jgi:DNA repair ATPase RecN
LTQVQQLGAKEKVKEVARMLGGEDYSEESLAHAQQMLAG